jgi:hypothetical protein
MNPDPKHWFKRLFVTAAANGEAEAAANGGDQQQAAPAQTDVKPPVTSVPKGGQLSAP